MNINDVEGIYSSSINIVKDFKSLNDRISTLGKKLEQVKQFEDDATNLVNSIYHAIEVENYNAIQKSKIMKLLEKTLRERRASKMCREYIEAMASEFELMDIKYKPLANAAITKAINKVSHKHNGIASKSKSSVSLVNEMIGVENATNN